METKLEREVRLLRHYAIGATLVGALLFLSAFSGQDQKQKFGEIDVERINIVERDGKLRMVISNQERQHPGIVNGKIIKRSHPRPPGMIFFNQLGDEMGGLVFGENGEVGHFGSLTFDKVRNDQMIGFRYLESDDGKYLTGLEIWQQPDLPADVVRAKYDAAKSIEDEAVRKAAIQAMIEKGELTRRSLFLGKGRNNVTLLQMHDLKGKPRIRILVTAEGTPYLEFLDEAGQVTYRLPDSGEPKVK